MGAVALCAFLLVIQIQPASAEQHVVGIQESKVKHPMVLSETQMEAVTAGQMAGTIKMDQENRIMMDVEIPSRLGLEVGGPAAENQFASRSRIMDADFAAETASLP